MVEHTANIENGNRSLQRGLTVLDFVARHGVEGVRVADIVKQCALERPTVYRLLSTLIACRYIEQVSRFRYALSANRATTTNDSVDHVKQRLSMVLKKVSELSEDATFAIVREGTQSHCIARHIGTHPVQAVTVEVGRRQPLGVGAAGMALLASLDDTEASKIIKANASALSAYGAMTPSRLQTLLKATRERGWSVVGNHVIEDILGVGVAVPVSLCGVPAAISVAAPILRMSPQRQVFLVKTIKKEIESLVTRK